MKDQPAESGSNVPNILVVDDTPANLQLLSGLLKDRGYKVRPVADGETALRAAAAHLPDLVMMDISMPHMDGYELCARLKADERLRDIPVLFISALGEVEDRLRAFQAGGVDYVHKPFQIDEVEARVRTHVQLHRQRLELQSAYERLRELERMRDSLTHMIVHDMKSPLLAMQLALDVIKLSIPQFDGDAFEMLATARGSADQLVEMINQMLDVSRLESGSMPVDREPCDMSALVNDVVNSLRPLAGSVAIDIVAPPSLVVLCDCCTIRRVVTNLVGNAIKFSGAKGAMRIVARTLGSGHVRIDVVDNGPGIPPDQHARIFEKFAQVENMAARLGTGLGLTFAKLAVEAHGGSIGVESVAGHGSTFWFTLPGDSG